MRFFSMVAAVVAMCVADMAHAERVGKRGCVTDGFNRILCAPQSGFIYLDDFGNLVCGKGQCIRDDYNRIICSSRRGGLAKEDYMGRVVCTGGCEEASVSNCRQPR